MTKTTPPFEVVRIKYVFIDVVEFTRDDRTIEDWLEIIDAMNRIVLNALEHVDIDRSDVIFLPTGDGMCLGLLDTEPYDVHVKVAQHMRHAVDLRNCGEDEASSRFMLKIAVNEHNDLVIKDINENINLAGVGINTTARILANCPPGAIMVGEAVYQATFKFKGYKGRYTKTEFPDKHGKAHIAYLLAPEANESESLVSVIGKVKGFIGPALTMDDINALKIGSFVYHKVDRVGRVTHVGPVSTNGRKRLVTIVFANNEHSVDMNNRSQNYYRWLGPPQRSKKELLKPK